MKDYTTARAYKTRPLLEGFIVGFCILLSAMLPTYFILHHALIAEKEEISESMLRQAKIIATMVDGDMHPAFTKTEQQKTVGYQAAIKPLARALLESCNIRLTDFDDIFDEKNGCSLLFTYTVIMRDNKVYYILDPWPEGLNSPDGTPMKSNIMDEYPEANPQLLKALAAQESGSTDVYTDDWGAFISAYAPFYNSAGAFIGVVGVDMRADRYMQRLEPIKSAARRAFLVVGIIAYLSGATIWFLRRFIRVINSKRLTLLDAYLKSDQEQMKKDE